MHPSLVDDVEQLLAKSGLGEALLEFEIANHLLFREAQKASQVLRQPKRGVARLRWMTLAPDCLN